MQPNSLAERITAAVNEAESANARCRLGRVERLVFAERVWNEMVDGLDECLRLTSSNKRVFRGLSVTLIGGMNEYVSAEWSDGHTQIVWYRRPQEPAVGELSVVGHWLHCTSDLEGKPFRVRISKITARDAWQDYRSGRIVEGTVLRVDHKHVASYGVAGNRLAELDELITRYEAEGPVFK